MQDFADIAQWSRGGGKNLGLEIGGRGGAGPQPPPQIRTCFYRFLFIPHSSHEWQLTPFSAPSHGDQMMYWLLKSS